MRDFLRENAILCDIKKTDYSRVDTKAKLWDDQAKAMGKTVEHLGKFIINTAAQISGHSSHQHMKGHFVP